MNNEPEFSVVNMYFGMFISFCIFNWLVEVLYQIFNSLYFIGNVIVLVVAIKMLMIFYNEMRIWARVI